MAEGQPEPGERGTAPPVLSLSWGRGCLRVFVGCRALGSLRAGWGGGPAPLCQAEVLAACTMLQQRGAQKLTVSVCQLPGGQGACTHGGNLVASSSCGTGRCLKVARALVPRAAGGTPRLCGGCGQRAQLLGSSLAPGQGGTAPSARGCGRCFPLSLAFPVPCPVQARSCQWLRARFHPCSHPRMCVMGLAGSCSRLGLQEPPEPSTPAHASSSVCSSCPTVASPLQAGTLGGQQSQQAGCSPWKPRQDVPEGPCWVVGCSLKGLVPGVRAHPWGLAALAGEQLCCPCRGCGQEGPGQQLVSPSCPFPPGRNYNQSCGVDSPGSCCTLDHIPLVR